VRMGTINVTKKMTSVNANVAFILTLFIAKSLLGDPAANTASERTFSLAGRTMEERRCQLHPDSVDGLLFVHGLKHRVRTWTRVNSRH